MIYRNRKSDLERAFQLLETAAKEKEEELKGTQPRLSPQMVNLISDAFSKMRKSIYNAESLVREGQEISKSIFGKMKKELERDPWKFTGKVALGSFGAGLILGIYCKEKSKEAK